MLKAELWHATFIIQRYIEFPALYKMRKFDIRCFGMLTCQGQKLKGYVYDDGYLRTSSVPFSKDCTDRFVHLTNDAVHKKSEDYGKHESGNKLSFAEY